DLRRARVAELRQPAVGAPVVEEAVLVGEGQPGLREVDLLRRPDARRAGERGGGDERQQGQAEDEAREAPAPVHRWPGQHPAHGIQHASPILPGDRWSLWACSHTATARTLSRRHGFTAVEWRMLRGGAVNL